VTARCNGRCQTCLWRDPERAELETAAVRWLYREAGRMGLAQLVVWGGEPLLRHDLPELLLAAREAHLETTLISNGWLLQERWPELRGTVDALILSLDDVGDAHDRQRALPGLYGRLERFVATLEEDQLRPTLLINTVLSRLNEGALGRVAPVARRWHAGLYFCPMETGLVSSAGLDEVHADLALAPQELRRAARAARVLKEAGYPILNTNEYLALLESDPSLSGYVCRMPRSLLTVEADGTLRDCLRGDHPLTTVAQLHSAGGHLSDVLSLPRYRALREEAAGCTKCNNPDVIELSWLWDLHPAMLRKVAELASL
jgi:MoaA/NifB/PqqE/SkfB family radical SAM enzyme